MNIRNTIGKLPLWKAIVIAALIFLSITFTIEELFLSRVFGVMDHVMTGFEDQKKSDVDDMEKDYQDTLRREKEDKEFDQHIDKQMGISQGNQ